MKISCIMAFPTEEPEMQLISQFCNHERESISVLRYSTQTCAITTATGKCFMFLEQIIFSYSVEMIYEESGDFWDLLEA